MPEDPRWVFRTRVRGSKRVGDRGRKAHSSAGFGERVRTVHASFRDVVGALAELGIDRVDGVLFDLGVSSFQLDTGFFEGRNP